MNVSKVLTFKQTLNLIKSVGHERTVIVEGEHGSAKTSLYYAMCADPHYADYIKSGVIDCAQLSDGSLWMYDIDREKGVSRELPNERFGITRSNQKGVNGARPVMLFFDEIAKSATWVKNMIAPPLYERRMGTFFFPEGSIVFGATNLAIEGLGDSMAPHLRDRIICITMRKPTQLEWKNDFALPRGLNATVIAFTSEYPMVFDSFLDYEEGGKYHGKKLDADNGMIFNPRKIQGKWATPRSLHAASDIVDKYEKGLIDDQTLEVALDGTIGEVARANLAAYVRFGKELTPLDRILSDPDKAPMSDNPTAQLIQVFKFVTQCQDRDMAQAMTTYVLRMRGEMQCLFANEVSGSSKLVYFMGIAAFTGLLSAHASKFQ